MADIPAEEEIVQIPLPVVEEEPPAVIKPEPVPVAEEAPIVIEPEPVAVAVAEVQPEELQAAAAEAATATEQEESTADPFHIGNQLAIVSDRYGLTVGRVAYRDANLVRIIPTEASDRAIDFRMVGDGLEFAPELGVSDVELFERQASDYYVDFLGAKIGETLEFFTTDGKEAAPSGVVSEIVKSATKDSIRLEDGRTLRFRGLGPEDPIAVIRVVTATNVAAATAAAAAPGAEEAATAAATEAVRQQDLMDLLMSALPAAHIEIIPTAERSYPDSLQREDLFQDLMASLSAKQKTNPRRIRYLEREVDLAMALKNAVVQRSDTGAIEGVLSQEINTFGDAVFATGAPVPVLVPIVAAAKALNLDSVKPADGSYKASDVVPRNLNEIESASIAAEQAFLTGSSDSDAFFTYMYNMFTRDQVVLTGENAAATEWRYDQDVIRTAGYDKAIQGLSDSLPSGSTTDKNYADVTLAFLVSSMTADRSVRVVGSTRSYNPKTGVGHTIAPSDPTALAGYVVLPPKAALKLRPPVRPGDLPMALLYSSALESDNLPTISRALQDLYSIDPSPQNAWTMEAGQAGSFNIADWLRSVLRYAVHPSESLGPRTSELLGVLDALGVGGRDTSVAVASVVREWVSRSQAQWRDLLKARREALQRLLDEEQDRVYQSVTGADSPLWPALLVAEPLKEIVEDIRRRNPAIAEAPTLMSAALTQEAQGDAAPLVWTTIAKLDNRPIGLDEETAAAALTASRSYTLRRRALRDVALLRMRAEPEINPCQHVKTLEAIRNLPDVLQRSRLLREFIEEYQGGRKGEWLTCTLCQQEAVCYHELMELEALAQPARMEAIQKQILIRFGGERFGRSIICKNCGQGLQELDYDEHVEFDDDGRPITGGSVLTDEQLEDAEETAWTQGTASLVAAPVSFSTVSKREIAAALQSLAGLAGVILTSTVRERIVNYADIYVAARTPPQADYEKMKLKKIDLPPYVALVDQIRVSALMALLGIELEIADPPLVVSTPYNVCPFARGGWPMNPAAGPEENGAIKYVACVAASFQRDEAPWRHMKWGGKTELKSRAKEALSIAWSACMVIDGSDPKLKTLLSITPEIRSAINRARADTDAQIRNAMISHTDQLPIGFRPEPFPVATARPGLERDPLPAAEAAVADGHAASADVIGAVAAAVRTQAAAVVSELHEAARAAIAALPQKPTNMTDFVCCSTPIREVEAGALLGVPESRPLVAARDLLRGAIPTAVNAGTHLWQDFEPPVAAPVEQKLDEGAFFKLFLKYCYIGPQVGEAHEFSVGNVCRQCGLALGKPMDLVDFGKEGAAILAGQQGDLRVETTAAAFEALSEAVRRRRILPAVERVVVPTWMEGLQSLTRLLTDSVSPSLKSVGAALTQVLDAMSDERAVATAQTDDLARIAIWEPLTTLYDAIRDGVVERIGPLVPTIAGRLGEARAREAANAMATFNAMTEDPFLEGPRTVQEYWCAKTQATASGYRIEEADAGRWFKKSRRSDAHLDRIDKIVADNSSWYAQEATLPGTARQVIGRIGTTLGPVIAAWIGSVRPGTGAVWGTLDAQILLRSIIMAVWRDATYAVSWIYDAESITGDAVRETTAATVADWTRALMVHVKQQFIRFSKERVQQVLQQRAEVERTAVVNEILGQADDDLRAAEFLKKTYRIGRWAMGKNLRAYDANLLDAEVEQRRAQGVVETAIDPVLLESQVLAAATLAPPPEDGYDFNQGAAGDDY